MRSIFFVLFLLLSSGVFAQHNSVKFADAGITFTGDKSTLSSNKQIIEFTGNVHFTTDIVEIEKADKIVYDRKTKTFTISGFKELNIHGKKRMAEDLGTTTLKIDLGDSVAYLIAEEKACPEGDGSC
ncbi:hypothetical protein [Salinimicrobium flavum]|uniref:Organic solvent tolerance-like N-terminal domain-containing protein n=1 Tax=Salinimicrobium flavum TaxID=1737065 RepID=A0ABW5J129_9FLAO